MKIVTASSGKQTVKISKSDWISIGKKSGWIKKAEYTTYLEEESKLREQQCPSCERFGCNGECTIPEFKGDVERIRQEVINIRRNLADIKRKTSEENFEKFGGYDLENILDNLSTINNEHSY